MGQSVVQSKVAQVGKRKYKEIVTAPNWHPHWLWVTIRRWRMVQHFAQLPPIVNMGCT